MSRRTITTLGLTALSLFMIVSAGPAQATVDAKPTVLKHDNELFVQSPGDKPHKYKYKTTTSYWSVVATSPLSSTNLDLRLYSDKAGQQLIKTSLMGPGVTDFIAIDSNHRALGTYFPRVDTVSGGGPYTAQLAAGSSSLGAEAQEVDMSSDQVVAIRDTYLAAGTTYRFVLSPGTGLMDADLFLVDSLGDTPSTWVKSRAQSLQSVSGSPGTPVIMQITPNRSDWYGLVIVREGAAGTYDLTRTVL
jgi:hypothetical protein